MLTSEELVSRAHALGLDAAGVCGPELPPAARRAFERWQAQGAHAGMDYISRDGAIRAAGARALWPETQSVLVVALSYHQPELVLDERARVARYALGKDYHKILRARLRRLLREAQATSPALDFRLCVDTAPLLERAYAEAAGLGWIGKSTMLISRALGSYTLLGAALLNQALAPLPWDQRGGSCGRCDTCLTACPTGALSAPGVLDARRCISYWTIEFRGGLADTSPPLDGWLFGCDRCQEACPFNRKARPLSERRLAARAQLRSIDAASLLQLDLQALETLIAGTPLKRAGVDGLRRNAARLLEEARQPSSAVRGGGSLL